MTENLPSLLIVDDEPEVLQALYRLFRKEYQVFMAQSAAEAHELLADSPVALVISDMRMPEKDGAQLLAEIKEKYPETVRILLTGYADIDSTVKAINDGNIYSYVSKPWDNTELLQLTRNAAERYRLEQDKKKLVLLLKEKNKELAVFAETLELKVKERTQQLEKAKSQLTAQAKRQRLHFQELITTLIEMIDHQLPQTERHMYRIASHARLVGESLKIGAKPLASMYVAALMFDIGRVKLPAEASKIMGVKLTASQWTFYHTHVVHGEEMVARFKPLKDSASILKHVYERVDGRGEPEQLSKDEIPYASRILRVVTDYDLMVSGQGIEAPMLPIEAMGVLVGEKGQIYDEDAVDHFQHVLAILATGSELDVEFAVSIHQLLPGMSISQDYVLENGSVLLTADQELTAHQINVIREMAEANKHSPVCWVKYMALGEH